MKTAIWFSRHAPSMAQIEDAVFLGFDLTVTAEGTKLGGMNIADEGDALACVSGLLGHCAEHGADAIFGVFAAPILAQIAWTAEDICRRGAVCGDDIPCFSSWKIMRPQEGGKPTFVHRKWLGVGRLNRDSCRLL